MNRLLAFILIIPMLFVNIAYAETCSVADYNANYWNIDATRKNSNNCYNYAFNTANNTFAIPGYGKYGQFVCPDDCCFTQNNGISSLALGDMWLMSGLRKISPNENCPVNHTKVMSAVHPSQPLQPWYDAHWYRQDSNGIWSHKAGYTEATDRVIPPNANNPNPTFIGTNVEQAANELGYTEHHQFYCYCGRNTQGGSVAPIDGKGPPNP